RRGRGAVRVAHALLAGEPQSDQVLRRLDEDGHLIAVVLAAVVEAVNGRADGGAKDGALSSRFFFRQDTGRTRTAVSRFAGARLSCSATVPEPPRGVEPLRAGSKPAALPTELRRQAGAANAPGSSDLPWRRQKRPLFRQQFLKRRPDPHGQGSLSPSFSISSVSPPSRR